MNKKIIIGVLVVLFLIVGFLYIDLKMVNKENHIITPPTQTAAVEISPVVFGNKNVKEKIPQPEDMDTRRKSVDEYGFPIVLDKRYRYESDSFLYKENDFEYALYTAETEGGAPIVKVSSSTSEYTGLFFNSVFDILSPNKHSFAFVMYEKNARLCIVQIDPKLIKCVLPTNSNTSLNRVGGNYDEPYAVGKWLDNSTFEYSVFNKDSPEDWGAKDNSPVLRTETISFK